MAAATPRPPASAVIVRPVRPGEIARWRHAARLPYLEISLTAGDHERPPSVTVATGPAGSPLDGICDAREVRQCAWLLLAAAAWLERASSPVEEPEADPQTSIFDHLGEAS